MSGSWPTALRIARREARRAKGRSALVLAMIALPVLALTFTAVTFDMFRLTPAETLTRTVGAADARVEWVFDGPIEQNPTGDSYGGSGDMRESPATAADLLALLPAGSRVIPDVDDIGIELRTAAGIGGLSARGLDVGDPLTRGLAEVVEGRAPAGDREVTVNRAAAERLGVAVGGTVRAADTADTWTVAGIVEVAGGLDEKVFFPPQSLPAAALASATPGWLVDTPAPLTWEQVRQLNGKGILVVSRAVVLDPPPAGEVPGDFGASTTDAETLGLASLVAGLGLLEVVLLAGPAFAVGARRRQRDLALVAANGGTPAHLRRIVLADGVVLGVGGAVIGVVLGIVIAFAARPLVEQYVAAQRAGGYRVLPLALLAIAGLAVVTGVLAALVPAFTAARQDVVTALTGRRGAVGSRKRWLFLGLLVTALGAATATFGARSVDSTVVLAGLVLGELGLVLCTPSLVGLIARLGRVLPLPPRIALRDTARNRAAAAPAISAVMAAVAGSVAIGVYVASQQEQDAASYRASMPYGHVGVTYWNSGPEGPSAAQRERVAGAVRAVLPVDDVAETGRVACPAGTGPDARCYVTIVLPPDRWCPFAVDQSQAQTDVAFFPDQLSPAQQRAAKRDPRCATTVGYWSGTAYGEIVADGPAVPALTGATGADLERAQAVLAAGGVVTTDPRFVVDGRATVRTTGPDVPPDTPESAMPTRTVPAYALTDVGDLDTTLLSPGLVAAAGFTVQPGGVFAATTRMPTQAEEDRMRAGLRAIGPDLGAFVERGPGNSDDITLLILGIAAGIITLGAAGIATGLAAADGRADLSTLAAVGASPRVRRLLSLSQSGVIAGLGSALGVVAGLGAAFAVLAALNQAGRDTWPGNLPYPLTVPWQNLLVVLVVPLVAMLGAGLLTRSRLPIERRMS